MRASLNWLKQYVEIPMAPEELASKLTMVGLEVESIERLGEKFDKFVIGRVVDVVKHPKADKLTVCTVNTGEKELRVVCGAPNVAAGQTVIIGLVGAVVPRNQHDPEGKPFTLTEAKIRGIESFGMICSAYEMDLGDDKDGIMVLKDEKAIPGIPLAKYFGIDDIAFEVGITPNRPDAMSHIGIAREVASLQGMRLRLPSIKLEEGTRTATEAATIVIEDKENCPRYTARVVTGVKVGESPAWLRKLLEAIGVRPVNNVVDITNYVLMEIGHPIHAFDYDKLAGHTIIVRRAVEGEFFVTLDHKVRKLKSDTLMICDGRGPVAMAGVMGGENSEISDSTINVLIESAYFNPRNIRKSSKHFGLSTDASQRFERGADPNITEWAANRTAMLVQEICGGNILKGAIDIYPDKINPRIIEVRIDRANSILGTLLNAETINDLLKTIEVIPLTNVAAGEHKLRFQIPTFRPDLEREIDLIEEIARIYGYDNIETKVRASISLPEKKPEVMLTDSMRQWLVGRGFNEVVTNSMQPKPSFEETFSIAKFEFAPGDTKPSPMGSVLVEVPVEVANPISKDMSMLRTWISTSLLQIVRNNIFHGIRDIRIFEIGKAYFRNKDSNPRILTAYREENRLAVMMSGLTVQKNWSAPQGRETDLYDLKGELEALFQKNSLDKFKFIPYTTGNALTDLGLLVVINGATKGCLGKVKPDMLKSYEIEQDVFFAEIILDGIAQPADRKFEALPVFPSVLRDLALVVDESVPVEQLIGTLHRAGGELIAAVELFDIYRGNQIGQGKKSCAFALQFQSRDKTLTQEEIDAVMKRLIGQVASQFQAIVRM